MKDEMRAHLTDDQQQMVFHLEALRDHAAYATREDVLDGANHGLEMAKALAEEREEARLFEALFESRCKLLEDTKRLGLSVCVQRAEGRAKLERIESEMCVCDEAYPWIGCLIHDPQSKLAAILGGSE